MAAPAALRMAENVWRIPTTPFDFVNTFAIVEPDGQVTLIDCGLKKAPPRIVAGLAAMGKDLSDVTRIVLTHAHSDHAGSAAEMARRTGLGVAIHADDAQGARTGKRAPSDPGTGLGRLANRMGSGNFDPVDVARELHDGDVLDVGGGLRVVHTPGHSPGHVALLHEPTSILITGDSIFNVLRLRWPPKAFCTDFAMTKQTAHVLGELDYTVAAFTHGPHVTDQARERVRTFLKDASR